MEKSEQERKIRYLAAHPKSKKQKSTSSRLNVPEADAEVLEMCAKYIQEQGMCKQKLRWGDLPPKEKEEVMERIKQLDKLITKVQCSKQYQTAIQNIDNWRPSSLQPA